MDHLFRGEWLKNELLSEKISVLDAIIANDLSLPPLSPDLVINAVDKLMKGLDYQQLKRDLSLMGLSEWKIEDLIHTITVSMTKEALYTKLRRELKRPIGERHAVAEGIYEIIVPLGVLLHIGAGNVVALSALSIIEGLLSGNINILKLPSYEGGISIKLLKQLVDIEPKLKPYVYVLDISSRDEKTLKALAGVSNGVVVWGSDIAIAGIRQIAPSTLKLIEWGHRISFAYAVPQDEAVMLEDLAGLAEEICLNNQQYCSSPQCVFVETDDFNRLEKLGEDLLEMISNAAKKYPQPVLESADYGEITWTKELVKLDEIEGGGKVLENGAFDVSVLIDFNAKLKVSPKNRNIWLMPIKRGQIVKLLRNHIGHLQTVGISCPESQREAIARQMFLAGVNRVTSFRGMSMVYDGEPHDGRSTLSEYVRCVTLKDK